MKTNLSFSKTTWTAEYLLKNPANFAKTNKVVWQLSVEEYLRRNKFSFQKKDLKKPLENVDFAKITRIYNTLMGKRNPPLPKSERKAS
jgi:hypothetical protein